MLLINDLSLKLNQNAGLINCSIRRVISSGWLVLGPEVRNFETLFADYNKVDYCVGVANGTDAIELGLRALGVNDNSRVATVANAGGYTATALNAIGAKPLFMDVDMSTQLVTLNAVENALEMGATAVVVTHLFGLAAPEIVDIAKLCGAHAVPLLEDCAQAHGARINQQHVGSFGDLGCFSFYPTKNLGALGDAGAILTSQTEVAETIRKLRQYGWTSKYQIDVAGGCNSRLDELQAAILSDFLPSLDEWNQQRRNVASRYNAEIAHSSVSVPNHNGDSYVAHLYVINCDDRQGLRSHLKQQGIVSDVHYPIPDHQQSIFKDAESVGRLPATEQLAKRILTLPCYPGMTDQQIEHVIDAVNSWII